MLCSGSRGLFVEEQEEGSWELGFRECCGDREFVVGGNRLREPIFCDGAQWVGEGRG